jgi:hypothetical protein
MESENQILRTGRVARLGRAESRLAPLVRYLFGPKSTWVVDPAALLVEIDRLGGVVVPADIMRVTGLRRAAAESLLCRLAARHGGDVFVHGTAVLYQFPRLMVGLPRLMSAGRAPRPIWEQQRSPDPVTGNPLSVDRVLVAINMLLLIAAATVVDRTLSSSVWQPALGIVLFAAALFTMVMPLARLFRRRAHMTKVAAENGRRALIRAVLQRPCGRALGAHALSHAWVAGSRRAINQSRLFDEVAALGGEPDVDVQARTYFRFPDLDHETRALNNLRLEHPSQVA